MSNPFIFEVDELEDDQERRIQPPRKGQREWTQQELDYSIIISPTSPGDDRFRIPGTGVNPSSKLPPFSTVCFIGVHPDPDSQPWGSGNLIAPQVVLTAGHVLSGVPKVRVTPGADFSAASSGNRRPGSPSFQDAESSRFRLHSTLDFGIVILPRPFTNPTVFMTLEPARDLAVATELTVAGFPCDKPVGTMWGHSEPILSARATANALFYRMDTCPGHSGSPVWMKSGETRVQVGVHTSGAGADATLSRCANDPTGVCMPTGKPVTAVIGENSGVRVNCEVINSILSWCSAFGVQAPTVDQTAMRSRCGGGTTPGTRPTVRRGSKGATVSELQTRLNQWLATSGSGAFVPLVIDGNFGPKTDAAVRAFQQTNGLVVDGIVGPKTWGKLLSLT